MVVKIPFWMKASKSYDQEKNVQIIAGPQMTSFCLMFFCYDVDEIL